MPNSRAGGRLPTVFGGVLQLEREPVPRLQPPDMAAITRSGCAPLTMSSGNGAAGSWC
jgi:hypothetical protein